MIDNSENLINKDLCKEKHKAVDDNIVDLRANIHTSKESLGNRLDEVDNELQKALLGDVMSPGGILRDIVEIKNDMKRVVDDTEKYEKDVDDKIKIQNFRIKLCIGLVVILIGGKFFGFSLDTIKKYFKPDKPITSTSSTLTEEDSNDIPIEIKEFIKKQLENQSKNK